MEEGINVFSIKDLENFSGIKAHTIRIWEKRYKVLIPDRTDSNIRTYNESELKKILNLAYLNRKGLKISKIARFTEDELSQKVMTVSNQAEPQSHDFHPGKVLMNAIRFNEFQFKGVLQPYINQYGIEDAYIRFLYPLLEKSKILWQTGSLSRSQEQFVRNIIRQILIVEDNSLKSNVNGKRASVAMINTADNVSDNNFLFYKYILRKHNYDVIYTGGILPASEVIEIHKIRPFEHLIVNSGAFDFDNEKISYFSNLGKSLFIKKIIFTDFPGTYEKKLPQEILITRNPVEFCKTVAAFRGE